MTQSNIHPRRLAREAVLKALYALELSLDPPEKVVSDIFGRGDFDDNSRRFINALFKNAVKYKDWCEQQVAEHLVNWNIERVALLDRLILQMAISEIYFMDDVPPKVSISEAIEIAKQYSTEESSSFVNGILDAIFKAKVAAEKNAVGKSTD